MKDLGFKIAGLRLDYGHRECNNAKYKICDILNDIAGELRDLREQNIILKERLDGAEVRCRMLSNQIDVINEVDDSND